MTATRPRSLDLISFPTCRPPHNHCASRERARQAARAVGLLFTEPFWRQIAVNTKNIYLQPSVKRLSHPWNRNQDAFWSTVLLMKQFQFIYLVTKEPFFMISSTLFLGSDMSCQLLLGITFHNCLIDAKHRHPFTLQSIPVWWWLSLLFDWSLVDLQCS